MYEAYSWKRWVELWFYELRRLWKFKVKTTKIEDLKQHLISTCFVSNFAKLSW